MNENRGSQGGIHMHHSFTLRLFLCAALLMALTGAACFHQPAAPPPEKKSDSGNPLPPATPRQVIDLVTDDYPPFQYMENGELKGLSVEITQAVFQRMGYSVTINIYPWARALDMVKKGETDGIFLIYKNPEREMLWLDYPEEPVLLDMQSMDTLTDSNINYQGDLTALTPYTIGTMRDYDYGPDFMTAIQNRTLRVEPASNNMHNLDKLLTGHIDIMADSWYVTRYNAKRRGVSDKIKTLKPLIRQPPIYLAFSKKRSFEADFLKRYNQTLLELK